MKLSVSSQSILGENIGTCFFTESSRKRKFHLSFAERSISRGDC